jgi:tetratricopeptide (TPR) repeat protein
MNHHHHFVSDVKMRQALILAAALFAAASAVAQETPLLEWQTDWNTAFKIAREGHRLVFVDYFAFSCTPSRIMEDSILSSPRVQERLRDFVLLREDFNHYNAPRGVLSFPTYAVYDEDQRERFRMSDPQAIIRERVKAWQPASVLAPCWESSVVHPDVFSDWLDKIREAAPSLVRAAEMLDSGRELEADFLLGNAYARSGNAVWQSGDGDDARAMYEKARQLAEKRGDKAIAQMADAESALTFAHESKTATRGIKLLQKLAANPVDRKTEAFIWLRLGRAYEIAKDPNAARAAYQRTQALAAPDSPTYREAVASIAKLK